MIEEINIYKGLRYSTSYINKNWRIKVNGLDLDGTKINKALGVSGLIRLIGIEFVNRFISRADVDLNDKITFKLRRGIKITLYVK